MSFLLMVFLTVVCVLEPSSPLGGSPGLSALATAAAVGLVGMHAWRVSRGVCRALAADPGLRDALLARYERRRYVHQLLLVGVFLACLFGLGWGGAVWQVWWDAYHLPAGELLTLLPFLAGQALSWVFFYDADRAVQQSAQRLLGGNPAGPGLGARWEYVLFQLRQKLSLAFIPVLLLVAYKEVCRRVPGSAEGPEARFGLHLVAMGALLAVFVCMPWIVRLLLGLRPLPAGPLRERLEATARRLKFKCSDLLLWDTRSGMANAMVIGIVPWVRYVVFTDRLVEEFPPDEVEAVFGHEAGHVRHHHMLYYLVFLTASMAVLGIVADRYLVPTLSGWGAALAGYLPGWADVLGYVGEVMRSRQELVVLPVMAVLLSYIFVVFGFLSRRCERQADVYGCRAVSCADPSCAGHGGEGLPAKGAGLCPTGIRTFIRALEKVAAVNGISRERPGFLQSWQHSTIARRVEFLQRMLADPRVEPRFQRRVALVKWALFAGLFAALALLVRAHGWGV